VNARADLDPDRGPAAGAGADDAWELDFAGLAEEQRERITRVYSALSKVDEAIVRIRHRRPLYEQVCGVLVKHGLRMAWVGEVGDDGWIVPVAAAGAADGYVGQIRISALDVPAGRGPTGTAVRERRHACTVDVARDPRMEVWRTAALTHGYRSSAAFPLVIEDRCEAVLTAYSSQPGFFGAPELELFDRMAADLSFALQAMRRDERRRAVEAELQLRAELLDLAHDAVIVLAPTERRVTFWNREAEAIYGYSRDEAIGRAAHELLATAFPESREAVELALARDGRWSGELRHTRKDGTVIIVSSRQAQKRGDDGQPLAVIELNSDITDRKQAEHALLTLNAELEQRVAARTADLARVNKELETFAYSVSHDLRAPLRAIDGFSKALLDDYGPRLDYEGRHYLQRVRAGAVRMGNLIDEILALSRLSRRGFQRERVDISALAAEIAAELTAASPHRELELEQGLIVDADFGLVRVVLQNLLSNAYKFTSKTPRAAIRFGAAELHGVPVYYVADNGAGFDMAHAERLFRPFHRLHRETEFPGDGIGLATVARAVHRHDGLIWANGAVDRGATFHFTLKPGAQPPATAATGSDVIPPGSRPMERQSDDT
jgi:PAS domain S-box-containing protein